MPRDRAALGEFLRARRDAITPAQAGVETFGTARRVPGLRRNKLAQLTGVSSEYCSRLEQGRQRNVFSEVLAALARALRLDDVEREHLTDLANLVARRPSVVEAPQRPRAGLLRVMTPSTICPSSCWVIEPRFSPATPCYAPCWLTRWNPGRRSCSTSCPIRSPENGS